MSGIILNPGTEPVKGAVSWENAYNNVKQFISECDIPYRIVRSEHIPDDGWYLFVLRNDECDYQFEIEMPGAPIEQVRYLKDSGQDPFNYYRLYIDGSSWLWCVAVEISCRASVIDCLKERLEETQGKIEEIRDKIDRLMEEVK